MPRKKLACEQAVDKVGKVDSATAPRLGALQNRGKTKETEKPNENTHSVHIEPYKLHWMWRETNSLLDRYARAVTEGRELDAAVAFARFVKFSGLAKFYAQNAQDEPLKVDGLEIEKKARALEMDVCDRWRRGAVPESRDTQLELLSHKLDLIAGRLAKVPIAETLGEVVPMPSAQGGEQT